MSIYEKLINTQRGYLYIQGKNPNCIKASCEYIENIIKGEKTSQELISKKYKISIATIREHYVNILNILDLMDLFIENKDRLRLKHKIEDIKKIKCLLCNKILRRNETIYTHISNKQHLEIIFKLYPLLMNYVYKEV